MTRAPAPSPGVVDALATVPKIRQDTTAATNFRLHALPGLAFLPWLDRPRPGLRGLQGVGAKTR